MEARNRVPGEPPFIQPLPRPRHLALDSKPVGRCEVSLTPHSRLTGRHASTEETVKVTKQRALKMLRKVGSGHLVAEAAHILPDPIDTERDGHLLARYGLTPGQLLERFGASP
jgi:hypothetical protein